MKWKVVPLEQLAARANSAIKIGPFGSQLKKCDLVPYGIHVVGIENVVKEKFDGFGERYITAEKFQSLRSVEVQSGDLLITMMGTVGEVAVVPPGTGTSVMDSHLLRFRPNLEVCSPQFVAWLIKGSPLVRAAIQGRAHGAIMKGLNSSLIRTLPAPLPPLAEQERIVKLLDEADELRKLRTRADQRTDDLIPALFHDMFDDTDENSKGLPVVPFGELLAEPLRNGLSPAKDGSYPAKVFTLSAITGEEFDGSAWKEASFARLPDRNCQATEHLFLICRGNGNRELVGRGKFPLNLTKSTVFPDTMIAAAPKLDRLLPAFLEAAWKQPRTRSQIQSNARTTNGTFKINQTAIEQIRLPVPPLPLQKEFAARVSEIRAMQAEQTASRRRLDDLFQSLLHRAFKGEL